MCPAAAPRGAGPLSRVTLASLVSLSDLGVRDRVTVSATGDRTHTDTQEPASHRHTQVTADSHSFTERLILSGSKSNVEQSREIVSNVEKPKKRRL